ncbi:MAG: helix-turn-helix domain-containing protein [Micromonosporaceae bacterium]
MPGRATDLIVIPGSFWQRAGVIEALGGRDIGRLFQLLRQYAGASQTQIAIACGLTQGKVSDIMRGAQKVLTLALFERIADGLQMPDSARMSLGLAPNAVFRWAGQVSSATPQHHINAISSRDTRPALGSSSVSDLPSIDLGDQEEEDLVRRRNFVGLAGASMFSAMLPDVRSEIPADSAGRFAPVLAAHIGDAADGSLEDSADVASLTDAVARARRDYQGCRYSTLIEYLPTLLTRLNGACMALDGEARLCAYALSADAHHVAAGLLLKLDDRGLAYLAADRSLQAAHASDDPLTIGASARIVTHTLMSGRHLQTAVSTAETHAQRLDHDVATHTPESLSVYGSLLLRGAIAAAQSESRTAAHELLSEADDAARRLGAERNLRWTAFGPVNAKLHRVNIAVALGDAGTAIDVARRIDVNKITVTERKASLFIDTARAFLQWGKHDRAYLALRAAAETAHQEVAGRPLVQRLVTDLARSAPPSVKPEAKQFARQLGIAR